LLVKLWLLVSLCGISHGDIKLTSTSLDW